MAVAALLTGLLLVLPAGCGDRTDPTSTATHAAASSASDSELTVFAASSLADVFQPLDANATFQFAASDALATQLVEGADADVYAAANTRLPDELYEQGIVEQPVPFATNHVVLVVGRDSRLGSLDDLIADTQARLVLAADGVPLGDYTVGVLDALHQSGLVQRASSRERDAKAVVAKVVLGEADAGFVYATDARASDDELRVIELPPTDANRAVYALAVVSDSPRAEAAQEFVEAVTSDDGRAALDAAGFGAP